MKFKEFVTEADFVNKPAGKIADEIAQKLGSDDARPSGRHIKPLPTGSPYPDVRPGTPGGDAGASPAELGKHKRIAKYDRGMDQVNQALNKIDVNKLTPDEKASLIKKMNRVLKSAGEAKGFSWKGKLLSTVAMLGSMGLEWLDPSLKEAIDNLKEDLVGQPVVIVHRKIINEQEILNEVQWILQAVHGFTVTLANPEDDRQTTRLNLADKKIDTTGVDAYGYSMLTITDDLSPAEKANQLNPYVGAKIDVSVSNLR
jgi:hypothetical protein